ncbi:AAA family ATPase [Branchiibius cervicis]|uniref:AAA family ATPase n=1 Tax=Branchiibius cervicis TaxID=908252 RepID=A0ABW2ANB4_9MICO
MSAVAGLPDHAELTYADAALEYLAAGFEPLPLPAGDKYPPPYGTTGALAAPVTPADVEGWRRSMKHGNTALRLPDGVVGIDVDDYDGKPAADTLAEREAQWGALPPTAMTTSRDGGVSGIRLYRVPPGSRFPGSVGEAIDVIQPAHRYAVVWPSVHPTGARYRWLHSVTREPINGIPTVAELPELPAGWVAGLSALAPARTEHGTYDAAWLDRLTDGDPGERLAGKLASLLEALDTGTDRHAAALSFVGALCVAVERDEPGTRAAHDEACAAFLAAKGHTPEVEAEWARLFPAAIGFAVEVVADDARRGFDWRKSAPSTARPQAARPAGRPVRSLAGQLLSRSGLRALPKPEPLIADTLDKHSVMMLAGYYGTGKSFVALDWAASIATGTPWLGRPVERGRVLYVLGEGAYGVHARLAAWELHHGAAIEDGWLDVLPVAAQIAGDDLPEVEELVAERGYALVVFDTLARMSVGLEENSARDMGVFVAALDAIRRRTDGGSVLVVHHSGKGDRGDSRGSSAIGGAMDIVYQVKGDGRGTFELIRTKRKEGPTEDRHALALREVAASVVVVEGDPATTSATATRDRIANDIREYLHTVAAHEASEVFIGQTQIAAAVSGSTKTIRETLARMAAAGFLCVGKRGGYALPTVDPGPAAAGSVTGAGPDPLPPGWDAALD